MDAARRRPKSPEASPAANPEDTPEAGGGIEGAGEGPLPPPEAASLSGAACPSPDGRTLPPAEPANSGVSDPAELAPAAVSSSELLCAPLLPRSSGTPARPYLVAVYCGSKCMTCAHSSVKYGAQSQSQARHMKPNVREWINQVLAALSFWMRELFHDRA